MGSDPVLYAIAESCPFDTLLVRDMRAAVNALLQLNLKRFRVPQITLAKYSALDIMKQALELLFEFSPSEKNYREAMRTIHVYSEGDTEMLTTLQSSFRLIANAVYNVYTGQRYAESISPENLFLQGVPFAQSELQQSFRFVGVRPPDVSPPNVKKTVFLDEAFEPYKLLLAGKITESEIQKGRERHWSEIIQKTLSDTPGKALIRTGLEHLSAPHSVIGVLKRLQHSETGNLATLIQKSGIKVEVVANIANVNEVFGKD
jgi:hypothetical protein